MSAEMESKGNMDSSVTKFGNVLVAVDGSESAERAARVAIEEALKFGANLTVLHIVEVPVSPFYPDKEVAIDVGKLEEEARTQGEKMVSRTASLAEARGVKVTQKVLRHTGHSTVEGITEYAKNNGIDMIVVGTSGRDIKNLLLGSVASGVVSSAACSVLVVR